MKGITGALLGRRAGAWAGRIAPPADAKTFYWISHGSPADPVWTYFLAGAEQWAKDTGNTVNTSFHNGDVAAHQEAVRAAIAAGADGIVTTSPDPGSLVEVAEGGERAPTSRSSTSTPPTRPRASTPTSAATTSPSARNWAQYLVDHEPGEVGRLRLDAGRDPRRHLRRAGGGGHQVGARARRHHLRGHRGDARPGRGHHPDDRLPDRQQDKIKAIIGLGDLVTGSIKRVFDQVGVKPGEIPVVGWGNSLDTTQEVLTGYVNAAQWQDPQATSYVALSLANMEAGGIPAGLRRHHRRPLREGHGAGLRRHPVGQVIRA